MKWYTRTRRWPAGGWIFARMLGFTVPYTGTISPRVVSLAPGRAVVCMRDRRGVRNHLQSVHAIALMNLAELSTGLAMTSKLDGNTRAILTRLSIDFVKKARGPITAECSLGETDFSRDAEHRFGATLKDKSGETVATATATWKVGPKRKA